MVKNLKKSDVLFLKYKSNDESIMECIGIVVSVSDLDIVIAHNFSDRLAIDSTKVLLKNILESKKILPKEINSFNDLLQ